MSLVIDMCVTPLMCVLSTERAGLLGFARGRGFVALGLRDLLFVFAAERLVDVEQYLLLPLAETFVGQNGRHKFGTTRSRLENPRADVELLGRDAQSLGDLLQDVGTGLAQPAFDLREVRVGHAREPRQLTQRNLRLLTLFA